MSRTHKKDCDKGLRKIQQKREINYLLWRKKIRKVAEREIENERRRIAFVEKESSLGFEPYMGYVCGKERIEWKIKKVKYMLEKS